MKSKRQVFFLEEQESMILELLHRSGHISVSEIIDQIGISPSTARIRLNSMHERGLLIRTHGGAIEKTSEISEAAEYFHEIKNLKEKEAIAKAARETVNNGDIIAIGAGTTMSVFARALHGIGHITVVTSSVFVASELAGDANFDVRICGGMVRPRTGSCFGPDAERFFDNINVTKCYFSFESISPEREFTTLDVDTRTDVALIKCAKKHYALADHTKLEIGPFFGQIGSFNKTCAMYMDSLADPEKIKQLRAAGLNVILAEI